MLESCRVGGVAGDGYANIFKLHDSNAFGNVVSAVALNSSSRTVGICGFGNYLNFFSVGVEFGLNICKAVDSGDDESSVLAETVEDNAEGLYSDLVCVCLLYTSRCV